jgi:hypothetical protein
MLGKPGNVGLEFARTMTGSWKKPRFFKEAKGPGKRLTNFFILIFYQVPFLFG